MFVALTNLRESSLNVRKIPPPESVETLLRESIESVGILEPLLCRPNGADNHMEVVLGRRRFQAAKALGLIEVPIEVRDLSDAEVRVLQLAENLQRESMHPVDIWRGINAIIQDGLPVADAAKKLGLEERMVRRLERLGRLDPTLLALAEIEMPGDPQLRVIAGAPAKKQASVAAGKDLITQRGDTTTVNWFLVAQRCKVMRISRSVAIFDLEKTKLPWDEDLFAEPGAPDQFTTPDVDNFIKAQTKALGERVRKLVADKVQKRASTATCNAAGSIVMPSGFQRVLDGKPGKLRAHEIAFHAIGPDGAIQVEVGLDTRAERQAEKKAKVDKKKPPVRGSVRPAEVAEESDQEDPEADEDEIPGRGPITQAGQTMIALAKMRAVEEKLRASPRLPATQHIQLLVLALGCDNVTVHGQSSSRVRFADLVQRLVDPGGNLLNLALPEIEEIGREAVYRIVKFFGPKATWDSESGAAGEIIGHVINAQEKLPRFDTKEFLATVSAEALRDCAIAHEIKPAKTVAALRLQLVGKMPLWRPRGASFGAPPPPVKE